MVKVMLSLNVYKSNGTPLTSPLPNPFVVNGSETITIRVYNSTTQTGGQPCYDEESLHFLVDDLPQAFPIPVSQSQVCDDEANSVQNKMAYMVLTRQHFNQPC